MTSERCETRRVALGLHALGQLAAGERAALEAHLDGCADCRREAAELRAVARALEIARAGPDAAVPNPPSDLVDRVVESVRADRGRARRRAWRVRAAVAAAAAAGVVTGAVGALALDGPDRPEGRQVAFPRSPAGVEARATLADREWGAGIWLDARGLRPGELYAGWLERANGSRVSAGTFRAAGDGRLRCYLTVGLASADAVAVGVSDEAGGTVLRARLA